MWLMGLVAVTLAAEPRELLDRGDAAWCGGHRAQGVRAWRQAVRATRTGGPEEHSVSISARARLIQAGNNWTPLVRGGGMNKALAACPPSHPRCQQAFVDFHLFVPAWMGSDAERALVGATDLALDLPGPAAARLHMLGAPDAPDLADELDLDGLGHCMQGDGFPRTGTSVVGVGVVADPGAGPGVGLRIIQPDGLRRRLTIVLDGFVTLYGGGGSLALDPPQKTAWTVRASGLRTRWWIQGAWVPTLQGSLMAGPRLRRNHLYAHVGPVLRWDGSVRDDGFRAVPGHGVQGVVALDHTTRKNDLLHGWKLGLSTDSAIDGIADYNRIGGVIDLRGYHPVGPIEGAARLRSEAAWFGADMPVNRTPAVGGPLVHRGARLGAHQGPWTVTADLEGRGPVWGPVWLAAFADVAVVGDAGVHGGGGLGLRLRVPPIEHNTLRFDFGVSDTGYQLQVGWGEAI